MKLPAASGEERARIYGPGGQHKGCRFEILPSEIAAHGARMKRPVIELLANPAASGEECDRRHVQIPVRPAFTLAELAVVLFIVGLTLSIVLPRFSGVGEGERLNSTCRRLAGMALEAYSDAVTKSEPRYLCLDLTHRTAWVGTERPESDKGGSIIGGRKMEIPDDIFFTDATHPKSGEVKEGLVSFGYWPQGGSEPGAIHLKTESGSEMTVFLRPYMGRTEIREGYLKETAG